MIAEKKVAFYTLGCKLNFSETSTIARNFVSEGFERVQFEEKADIYVINTCSVTENADKRFKSIVKNALKKNDEAFLIAVGCYAQLKPEELAAVDGVDLVLGATEKFNVTSYINDLTKNNIGEVHSCEISDADFYVGSYSIGDRTRAFLKVQDGCDYKCTYCTIPLARGISRSDTVENVLKNVLLFYSDIEGDIYLPSGLLKPNARLLMNYIQVLYNIMKGGIPDGMLYSLKFSEVGSGTVFCEEDHERNENT